MQSKRIFVRWPLSFFQHHAQAPSFRPRLFHRSSLVAQPTWHGRVDICRQGQSNHGPTMRAMSLNGGDWVQDHHHELRYGPRSCIPPGAAEEQPGDSPSMSHATHLRVQEKRTKSDEPILTVKILVLHPDSCSRPAPWSISSTTTILGCSPIKTRKPGKVESTPIKPTSE